MYIIAGLGNPGKEYMGTRHNVGYETVDRLAKRYNLKMNKLKFNSVYDELSVNGEKVVLLKPVTYMNRSGIAIAEAMSFFKVPIENLIVIYDDIDIPLGTLRIRPHGSSGTHNGMKSIIKSLGSEKFPRLRIGIGRNPDMDLADFVLQKFSQSERDKLEPILNTVAEAVICIIEKDLDTAMQNFNIKTIDD